MDATLAEFKRKLLDTGLFRKVSGRGQYRCQTCPFCGDTKNHMYVKIDQGSDEPVVYKCFKCAASGIMNQEWLDYFDITDIQIPKIKGLRKIQSNGMSANPIELIDFEKDTVMVVTAAEYIQKRVGVYPSKNELKAFQVIGNVYEYVNSFLGGDSRGLKDRVWFRLTNANIAGRALDDNNEFRWRKRNRVTQYGSGDLLTKAAGLYIIRNQIDPYQTINICICEGVMDAIGLYYHGNINNAVYVACMGLDYQIGMKYAMNMGLFGDNVVVRIFKDPNIKFVNYNKQWKNMFKSITVYHNATGKDYGVPGDMIEIEKC